MSVLFPRLPQEIARAEYQRLISGQIPTPSTSHPFQVYAPVGGRRADPDEIGDLVAQVATLAGEFGYPRAAGDSERIAFDRSAASLLRTLMDIGWSEAEARGIWSFLALVALPDLTQWRFGITNQERWVASDLTRHTWSRLWWQAVVFEKDPDLLDALTESDLNQLLERRKIGGDPRLVLAVGRTVLEASNESIPRRALIRDVAARLMRRLAFIDARALTDQQLGDLCRSTVKVSVETLASHPDDVKALDEP